MKNYTIITFVLLVLNSCISKSSDEKSVIDENITINNKLIKLPTDILRINLTGFRYGANENGGLAPIIVRAKNYPSINFFEDNKGICRLVNDSIFIDYIKGFGPIYKILLKIHNGKFDVQLFELNCTYRHHYILIQKKLVINKSSFKIGDTLIGDLSYKGVFVYDSIKKISDTISILGKFKLKVRDKFFDDDSLEVERRYFILNNPKPEMVKELNLSKWRLNSLPLELKKFKNLEILDLSGNDLGSADFSILCEFKNLKTIYLNSCELSKLPTSIFCLKKLEEIEFSYNDIEKLPLELFQLSNIKEIRMNENPIPFLPKEILKLKKLELLDISNFDSIKSIKKIPANFFKSLKNLKEIRIPIHMEKFQFKKATKSVNVIQSV